MSENTMAPPLDVDLATVDTSMPLLKDGEFYDLLIEKAEVKPTQKPGGKFIALDMKTTQPAKSMKNEDLGAGVHVFDNCNLVPTGKATWDMISRNLGALFQSAGVAAKLSTAETSVPQLQGKVVRAKIGYSPERIDAKSGKQLRARNEVLLYVKRP